MEAWSKMVCLVFSPSRSQLFFFMEKSSKKVSQRRGHFVTVRVQANKISDLPSFRERRVKDREQWQRREGWCGHFVSEVNVPLKLFGLL